MITLEYAGIGSRETPPDAFKRQMFVSNILAQLGYRLRSGGCPKGGDEASLQGAYRHKDSDKSLNRIYVSWNGMAGHHHAPERGVYDATRFENYEQAKAIALETRGSFERLGAWGIAHMTRNVYQVLGDDLNSPVDFVLCWGIPVGKTGVVKGGTGQATKLAVKYGIPIYNFYDPEFTERMDQLIANVTHYRRASGWVNNAV